MGLEMTLEGAEGRIRCSKIGWQTVPCSWSTYSLSIKRTVFEIIIIIIINAQIKVTLSQ